jgi:hypothetical protein
MSDKELVINLIRELPESASLADIAKDVEFLAAIREAEEEADCGQVVSHEDLKRESATWRPK